MESDELFQQHLVEVFGERHLDFGPDLVTLLRTLWDRGRDASPPPKHRFVGISECTYHNSGISYSEGYDTARCACGWKSPPAKKHEVLVAMYQEHANA